MAKRELESALWFYRAAEEAGCEPDRCAGARWICHMLKGDYESAWRESDAISTRGNADPNRFWSGRPLVGKHVLIRCLHGLGDTLQYVRYVPELRKIAASVTLEAQPQLKELLAAARIGDCVITWGESEPRWDEQIEIVELPFIFRSTVSTLPAEVPYLFLPEAVLPVLPKAVLPEREGAESRAHAGTPMRIGVMWASSTFNRERSVPLGALAEIFECDGARFFSFQPDPERAQLSDAGFRMEDYSPADADVLMTAYRLMTMDLLITVDTMLAHLAGALGLRVWLLLPFAADWRWMVDRVDSPWYPTMRLFRQPTPGDWRSVTQAVKAELECGEHSGPHTRAGTQGIEDRVGIRPTL